MIFDFLVKKHLDEIVKFIPYNLWNNKNLILLLYKVVTACVPILHNNYLSMKIDPIFYKVYSYEWVVKTPLTERTHIERPYIISYVCTKVKHMTFCLFVYLLDNKFKSIHNLYSKLEFGIVLKQFTAVANNVNNGRSSLHV